MTGKSKKEKFQNEEATSLNTAAVHTNNVIVEMKGKLNSVEFIVCIWTKMNDQIIFRR